MCLCLFLQICNNKKTWYGIPLTGGGYEGAPVGGVYAGGDSCYLPAYPLWSACATPTQDRPAGVNRSINK